MIPEIAMTIQNASATRASQSLLWGRPVEFWDNWGFRLLVIGAAVGVLALIVSLISSVVLYRVAGKAQEALATKAHELETTVAGEQTRSKQFEATTEALKLDVAQANERAADATKDAARLGLKVDALPAFVSEKENALNALAERMNRSGAELGQARKDAQASQLKAEAALQTLRKESEGRFLTEAQTQTIISTLRGKLTIPLTIQSDPGDVEAYPFAKQILEAVKLAGISGEYQPWPTIFAWFNEPGLFVVVAGDVPRAQVNLLLEALRAAGLHPEEAQATAQMVPAPALPGRVSILVWKRPPPLSFDKR